jgi:hypothetical protein
LPWGYQKPAADRQETGRMRILSIFGFLASTLFLTGCGDDDPAAPAKAPTGIEIAGTWSSNFGGTEIIADESWTAFDSTSEIAEFSNSENVAITRNPEDADFSPGKYNRNVWTEISDGSFYYCTADFALDTLEDAQAADTVPDDSDPDNTGCGGGNPWTKLTRE